MKRAALMFAVLPWLGPQLRAHAGAAPRVATGWEFDPAIVIALFLTIALYVAGLRTLRRATVRPGKLRREAWRFGAGWIALVVALVSPVHTVSREFFWVHMTQHELLMVVAAPLLVLGRPAIVMAWAFPRPALRRALAAARAAGGGVAWHASTSLVGATAIHGAALWIWHVPALFDATLTSEWVHALQHVSFTGTAVLFWHAVLYGRNRAAGYGVAVLMLFFTAGHSGALGALLTFASRLWYPGYADVTGGRALTALEDQQLGGLIMWVPAGLVYVVAGLALFSAWLQESDRMRNRRLAARSGVNPSVKCAAP